MKLSYNAFWSMPGWFQLSAISKYKRTFKGLYQIRVVELV